MVAARGTMLYRLRGIKQNLSFETSNYVRLAKAVLFRPSDNIVNQTEIRFSGLQRSGNHAVIGWIRGQHPDYGCHLNHCPPGKNPYQYLYRHYKKADLAAAAQGHFKKQSLLIISYENQPLSAVSSQQFERFHDVYVGRSQEQYDAIVLRDPFNLLASQLKSNMCVFPTEGRSAIEWTTADVIRMWIAYAKEFVGETRILPYPKIPINFNQWHTSIDYRRALMQRLGMTFTDAGRDNVRNYGGGSSFDGQTMNRQGSRMDVLGRWHQFHSEEIFWQVFNDDELLHYTELIFDRDSLPFDFVKR